MLEYVKSRKPRIGPSRESLFPSSSRYVACFRIGQTGQTHVTFWAFLRTTSRHDLRSFLFYNSSNVCDTRKNYQSRSAFSLHVTPLLREQQTSFAFSNTFIPFAFVLFHICLIAVLVRARLRCTWSPFDLFDPSVQSSKLNHVRI